jgi:hypothetical protein
MPDSRIILMLADEVMAGNHVLEAMLALWNMPSECSAESLDTAVIFRIADAIMSIEHICSLAQGCMPTLKNRPN